MSNFGTLHNIWCKRNGEEPGNTKTRGQLVENEVGNAWSVSERPGIR